MRLSDCSSRSAMVSHAIQSQTGNFLDFSHGGTLWTTNLDAIKTGADNPIGYGDGSVIIVKKSQFKLRATYNYNVGQAVPVQIYY
jgi:hypothetical protein